MTRSPMLPETVSVTELYSFRECRRAWYLSSVRNLVPKVTPMRYWFGTGIHAALAAYHGDEGSLERALEAYDIWYRDAEALVAEEFGYLWEGASREYYDARDLTRQMLTNYDEFHRAEHDVWEPVAVEQRVWVTIHNPHTSRALPTSPRLTARFDFLGARPNRQRHIIVDHKSASQQPAATGRDLDLDDQLTGYAYVYWRLTGELPEALIYNTLIKRVPSSPEILKNGTPSRAKGQSTTFGLYLQTLHSLGLDPSSYAEVLLALQNEGWSRYFVREGVTKNLDQLRSYEEHLYFTYRDMVEVVKNPALAYPSPSGMRCGNCPFLVPCQAMEDGSDAESMIEARFKVSTEQRW